MKVNYSVEMDVNELNAVINGVKDILNFIAAQKKQDDVGRKLSDLESHYRSDKASRWWNEDKSNQPKNSCK